jgi:MoaA/NifB/PqqE/SkfB family radical SAM enzyme
MAPDDEIKQRIIEGRRNGATRLILSGGEPTIHPSYIKFIKYGRLAGYRRVQTVTNGRLFSYPDFLGRCLDAGLQEITFSIHGHNAKVHDALVGVKGAFDEEVEGLRQALADGRPIVNIDVCLNRGNIRKLPELLDRFIDMGVREFDLLHLIPFGDAWDKKHRDTLMYDIDEAMPFIQAALAYSERSDIHIWFNRFPPPYLENYEHLIQDPYKLNDEVRGRYEEYELWMTRDMPISCREPERCDRCYLQNVCDSVENTMTLAREDGFDAYLVRADAAPEPEAPAQYGHLWIKAADLDSARPLARQAGWQSLILELDCYDGFLDAIAAGSLAAERIERVIVEGPEDLDAMLAAGHGFEVQLRVTTANAAHLIAGYPGGHPRLSLTVPNYERATDAADHVPDLEALFAQYKAAVPVENVPACVLGRAPRARLRVLEASMLKTEDAAKPAITPGDTGGRGSLLDAIEELGGDDMTVGDPAARARMEALRASLKPRLTKGVLDPFGFIRQYVREGYYSHSHRCKDCALRRECEGMHINVIRAHGYKWMKPLVAPAHDDDTEATTLAP